MKNKLILVLAILGFAAPMAHAQVLTTFTLENGTTDRGTFHLQTTSLWTPSQLSYSGNVDFNYAYAVFTPTVTGTYSLGVYAASFDPLLILYSGLTAFPANPADNVIGFNDDGEVSSFQGLPFTNDVDVIYNPIIEDVTLVAGMSYLMAITTPDRGDPVELPLGLFVYGEGAVNFTPSAVPEPSTYAAIFGAVALGGAFAWRRRKQA